MPMQTITTAEVAVGAPLKQELFQKIKDNFDFLGGLGSGAYEIITVLTGGGVTVAGPTVFYFGAGASIETTLPDPATVMGVPIYMVFRPAAGRWTITTPSGVFLGGTWGVGSGKTSIVFLAADASMILISDGVNYIVTSSSGFITDNLSRGSKHLSVTTASLNTIYGPYAREALSTDYGSTFIGYGAGRYLTSSSSDVFIGMNSGEDAITTCEDNVAVGHLALAGGGVEFSQSVAIGYRAAANGASSRSYIKSVAIGSDAEVYTSSRDKCIAIGYNSKCGTGSAVGRIAIGANVTCSEDNSTCLAMRGTTGGSDVRFNTTTKEIFYDTSALRFKENVRPVTGTERIFDLAVKLYDRVDGSRVDEVGLIADEVVEVIPEICSHNEGGLVESYSKSDLVPFLLHELQKLKADFEAYKASHP